MCKAHIKLVLRLTWLLNNLRMFVFSKTKYIVMCKVTDFFIKKLESHMGHI